MTHKTPAFWRGLGQCGSPVALGVLQFLLLHVRSQSSM